MKKQKMTNRLALNLIKKNRPKTLLETSLLGLKLVHLGTGAFRAVYRIKGTDYVIKFPEESEAFLSEDSYHSQCEVRNIKRMRASRSLRRHLPKIHYHNRSTGVIVMDYYIKYNAKAANQSHPTRDYGKIGWERMLIIDLIKELTGVWFSDIYPCNLRLDKNNVVKFVDVGC